MLVHDLWLRHLQPGAWGPRSLGASAVVMVTQVTPNPQPYLSRVGKGRFTEQSPCLAPSRRVHPELPVLICARVPWPQLCAPGPQLDALLRALVERRSFPETLLLEARGSVGEGGSASSTPMVTVRSALALVVRQPGKQSRQGKPRSGQNSLCTSE